jgi:hypothetical protein
MVFSTYFEVGGDVERVRPEILKTTQIGGISE